jgi:hypothetical protein
MPMNTTERLKLLRRLRRIFDALEAVTDRDEADLGTDRAVRELLDAIEARLRTGDDVTTLFH